MLDQYGKVTGLFGKTPLEGYLGIARQRDNPFSQGGTADAQWFLKKENLAKAGLPYKWDSAANQIVLKDNWKGTVRTPVVAGPTKKANANTILSTQLTEDQAKSFIPPLVKQLI